MWTGNRLGSDISRIVGAVRHRDLPKGFYLGWVGHGNLGDEVLETAIYRLLSHKKKLLLTSAAANGLVLRMAHSYQWPSERFVVLGGGTLIFESDLGELRFDDPHIKQRVAFGTGVESPEFWDRVQSETGNARSTEATRQAWVAALNQFDYLGVRGDISKEILVQSGVHSPIISLGDPALAFTKEKIGRKRGKKKIGINIGRADLTGEGFLWGRDLGSLVRSVASFTDALISEGWDVEFVPVWRPDLMVIEQVRSLLKEPSAISIFKKFLNVEAVLARLGGYDVFVGMKLHSVVLACCAGTPSIMIEYRPKCRDFMHSIGMDEWVIRTDQLDAKSLENRVDSICSQSSALQKRLHERCIDSKRRLVSEGNRVSDLLTRERT